MVITCSASRINISGRFFPSLLLFVLTLLLREAFSMLLSPWLLIGGAESRPLLPFPSPMRERERPRFLLPSAPRMLIELFRPPPPSSSWCIGLREPWLPSPGLVGRLPRPRLVPRVCPNVALSGRGTVLLLVWKASFANDVKRKGTWMNFCDTCLGAGGRMSIGTWCAHGGARGRRISCQNALIGRTVGAGRNRDRWAHGKGAWARAAARLRKVWLGILQAKRVAAASLARAAVPAHCRGRPSSLLPWQKSASTP